MPTTYTHDCFGIDVFHKLPENIKETIRHGKGVYRIGLHGPDIFFYYHPIIKNKTRALGSKMHDTVAADFFLHGIEVFRANPSEELAAYLLGFACHYLLDSTCHGYIKEYEIRTGASHAEIEEELDRYYMIREGKKPRKFLPGRVLDSSVKNCKVIGQVFEKVGYRKLQMAVWSQKVFDRLLTCGNPVKEKIVLGGMKVLGIYDVLEGQVMRKEAIKRCEESTQHLAALYEQALKEAPEGLQNLYECLYEEGTLSQRFYRDFN